MHAASLVDALKRLLKGRGMTYAVVAKELALSEASANGCSRVATRARCTRSTSASDRRASMIGNGPAFRPVAFHPA